MNGSIDMVLIGNISTEPQLRQVGENIVCNFNIAINQGKGDSRKTRFIRCAAWNKLADVVANYAQKGDPIKVNAEWLDLSVYANQAQIDINVTRVNLIPNGRRESINNGEQISDIPF